MRTDSKTVGFGGGFTDARALRPERRAAHVVQVRHCEGARLAAYEDARPVLQHRTGASNCDRQLTEESIARMPRYRRWGLYALAFLTMSGIIPALACNALLCLCESVGWCVLIPLCIVVGRAFWRVMWS